MKKSYATLGMMGLFLAAQLNLVESEQVWGNPSISSATDLTQEMELASEAMTVSNLERSTIPAASEFKTISKNGLVQKFKDSTGVIHTIKFSEIKKHSTLSNYFEISHEYELNRSAARSNAYFLTLYRKDGNNLSEVGTCKIHVSSFAKKGKVTCSGNFEPFNDQRNIYLRFGIANSTSDTKLLEERYYKVANPLYLTLADAKLTSFTVDTPSAVVGSDVVATATAVTGKETLYRFQVYENGVWNTKQDYSKNGTFKYNIPNENYHNIRVYTKHPDSKKEYDDMATTYVKGNAKPSQADYVTRIGGFSEKNGTLSIDGYSYIKGVQMSSEATVLRKLKVMDLNTGTQVTNYELADVQSSSLTKDKNHGNERINYDWAKFDAQTDLSALPIGEYYFELYTKLTPSGSKSITYDRVLTVGSNIADFSYVKDGKKFTFTRTHIDGVSTLAVKVEKSTQSNTSTPTKAAYKTNVSQFKVVNGRIHISGYAYIEGLELRNSKDALKKLKFTDANTNQYIKAYEVPNVKSTYFSTHASHGNGKLNYDWAKFEGVVDVSDLPVGEYHLKVYSNIKNNKRDEIIKFQSSIEDFSFTANNKLYSFERVRVKGVSTLQLTVTSLKKSAEEPVAVEEQVATIGLEEMMESFTVEPVTMEEVILMDEIIVNPTPEVELPVVGEPTEEAGSEELLPDEADQAEELEVEEEQLKESDLDVVDTMEE